jgi:hypothetical protein
MPYRSSVINPSPEGGEWTAKPAGWGTTFAIAPHPPPPAQGRGRHPPLKGEGLKNYSGTSYALALGVGSSKP